ncbi:efflux RND transporter periplasmic adaptor subunit [Vibrio sp. HN007]|uniref:efflux RND transporter periplasmic adaptor subunit n=1 Tax=Vibrio iocasae TaxID=3098914 RepID=UPI0035D4BB6B
MFRKNKKLLITLIASVIGLTACNNESEVVVEKEQVRPVKIAITGMDEQQNVTKFPAVVNDNRLVELSFSSGGKLVEFPVKGAQQIKKGDLIARLDQQDLKNNLDKARVQYTSADQEYKRAVQLSKSKAISKSTLQQRKTERDVSLAQLNSAKKAVNDAVLLAPFDGVVAQTMVENGQSVSGGQAVIVLIGGDTLEASIDIPASYLANLYESDKEDLVTESYITLDIAPQQPLEIRFKEALLIADATTQTYSVTFEFSAPEDLLVLPGMSATIEMRAAADIAENRVSVPLNAITSDGEKNYVWVVNQQDMTVAKREVMIAEGIGDMQVVIDGLEQNEWVVSAGVSYLYEGMKVRKWQ